MKYNVCVTEFKGSKQCQIKTYSKLLKRNETDSEMPLNSFKNERLTNADVKNMNESDYGFDVRNIKKSFDTLIGLVRCNADIWLTFSTYTFAENITNLSEADKMFQSYIKQCKRHYKDFKCIYVPEYQKRGAVHYHMVSNIPCGHELIPYRKEPVTTFNKSKNKKYIHHYYDLKYWKHGYSTAESFNDKDIFDDKLDIGLYLGKYLMKDIDNRLFGRQKYRCVGHIDRPVKQYMYLLPDEIDTLINDCNISADYKKSITATNEYACDVNIFEFNVNQ